ncbi:MAG: peptidoglycan editing factor PgeF [Fibrobacteres bacterium]|nr:peptidoglycan editing factor PgeF [Fibrobacterota bacterium]
MKNPFRSDTWNHFSKIAYGFSTVDDCCSDSQKEDMSSFMLEFDGVGEPVLLQQIHSNIVLNVNESFNTKALMKADGFITNLPDLILTIKTADCVPVLIYDPANNVIGAVHSGWRGTKDQITSNAISLMNKTYGTIVENVEVIMGPAIKSCCYEIQDDVVSLFNHYPDSVVLRNGSTYLEQKKAIRYDLENLGVYKITDIDFCTGCRPDLLCSWRKQKTEKRLYSSIMLRS